MIDEEFQANGATISYLHNPLGEFKPIPLTEEWLLKFGFEEVDKERAKSQASWKIMAKDKFEIEYSTESWFLNNYKGNHQSIAYIHQLQNLYFALTNTELEDLSQGSKPSKLPSYKTPPLPKPKYGTEF